MENFIKKAIQQRQEIPPQMDYMWRVDLPDLSAYMEERSSSDKVKDGPILAIFDDDFIEHSQLNHRITSFDIPTPSFEMRKVVAPGAGWKNAGMMDLAPISIKMMEFEDGSTLNYLNTWQSLMINDDGTRNMPVEYKKDIRLTRLSQSGFDIHISMCKGCFPIEVGNINYSYESNTVTQYGVTFSVDSIEHEIIPFDQVRRRMEKVQTDISNSPTNPFSSVFDVKRIITEAIGGV
mgnify:CR=1 FL=1